MQVPTMTRDEDDGDMSLWPEAETVETYRHGQSNANSVSARHNVMATNTPLARKNSARLNALNGTAEDNHIDSAYLSEDDSDTMKISTTDFDFDFEQRVRGILSPGRNTTGAAEERQDKPIKMSISITPSVSLTAWLSGTNLGSRNFLFSFIVLS